MWTNVDQCAPVARAHAARPSPVRQPPSASGRRVQSAADGRANRNAAHSVNWLGDGGLFDTPLTRQSASQKFNRDEIEEGVEVLGHGAPVSATLAQPPPDRVRERELRAAAGWANQTLGVWKVINQHRQERPSGVWGSYDFVTQRFWTSTTRRARGMSPQHRAARAKWLKKEQLFFLPRRE